MSILSAIFKRKAKQEKTPSEQKKEKFLKDLDRLLKVRAGYLSRDIRDYLEKGEINRVYRYLDRKLNIWEGAYYHSFNANPQHVSIHLADEQDIMPTADEKQLEEVVGRIRASKGYRKMHKVCEKLNRRIEIGQYQIQPNADGDPVKYRAEVLILLNGAPYAQSTDKGIHKQKPNLSHGKLSYYGW